MSRPSDGLPGTAPPALLRDVYFGNRATEATLRSVIASGLPRPTGDVRLDRAARLRLEEQRRVIEGVHASLCAQGDALAAGAEQAIADAASATERRTLTLREAMHAGIRLVRLTAKVPPLAPAEQVEPASRAAAAELEAAGSALGVAAAAALHTLRANQAAAAVRLDRWESLQLAAARRR